ncbi:hypothetical protein ACH4T9_19995 [Micromonospora sp. NPDC020750]|uniref:hypothetical protein n=1 Tax=unclassified Micromonospora TaxID=2617518 RepID=UPI00379E6344
MAFGDPVVGSVGGYSVRIRHVPTSIDMSCNIGPEIATPDDMDAAVQAIVSVIDAAADLQVLGAGATATAYRELTP